MHLNTITELLGIPNYKAAEMIKNTPDRIELMLEQIEVTDPICSGCGRIHNTSVHSTMTIVVEDLRISGKRIFLHVPKPFVLRMERSGLRRSPGYGIVLQQDLRSRSIDLPPL